METITQKPARIQFAVAEVTPTAEFLPATSAHTTLEAVVRSPVLACPVKDEAVLVQGDFNPLIAAAFLAFKLHYPLVLSPDMIWLTILQGVAQHVQNHAETLRKRLVFHETKIELVVKSNLGALPQNDAEMLGLTREFVARISRHVPADKQFLFQTEFSTTSAVDRIATSVALMDTFQPYFDYVVMCVCGIPSITLEGSPEDWRRLKSKVESLHASDLELSWWTGHLIPLCEHFVRAASGEVDRAHWQNLCKIIARYGTEDLNGWLLKFIPYVKAGKDQAATLRNPVMELSAFPDPDPTDKRRSGITGCTSDMLPSGLSRVPVKFMSPGNDEAQNFEFVAGLVGVTQSPQDFSLRPLTGWAICEGAPIDRCIAKLRLHHEVLPPAGMNPWEMSSRVFQYSLPADLCRFYSETNGAAIKYPDSRQSCRILPLAEITRLWDPVPFTDELREQQKRGQLSAQELSEHQEFNRDFGELLRIAELADHNCYVFGRHPKVRRSLAGPNAPVLSASEWNAKAIFLWTGERKPEAFTFVASSFSEFLALLLGGPPD